MELTHLDQNGHAHMVDVSEKEETRREALATGSIFVSPACFEAIKEGTVEKGDVLACARIAGIMGAKRCPDLIPLCHVLNLTKVSIDFALLEEPCRIKAGCLVKTTGKTGVEMEALTGVTVALLTIYDMCKAVDKTMEIGEITLVHKYGGKSGAFQNPNAALG